MLALNSILLYTLSGTRLITREGKIHVERGTKGGHFEESLRRFHRESRIVRFRVCHRQPSSLFGKGRDESGGAREKDERNDAI